MPPRWSFDHLRGAHSERGRGRGIRAARRPTPTRPPTQPAPQGRRAQPPRGPPTPEAPKGRGQRRRAPQEGRGGTPPRRGATRRPAPRPRGTQRSWERPRGRGRAGKPTRGGSRHGRQRPQPTEPDSDSPRAEPRGSRSARPSERLRKRTAFAPGGFTMISRKSLRKRLSFAHIFCEGEARGGVEPRHHHVVTPEEPRETAPRPGFVRWPLAAWCLAPHGVIASPLDKPIRQRSFSQEGLYHFFRM